MYFNINSIILFFIGLFLFIFARPIAGFILRRSPKNKFQTPLQKRLLFFWPTRIMGVMCISYGLIISMSGPSQTNIKRASNLIKLLESGVTCRARVVKVLRQYIAPAGWEVIYEFESKDTDTGILKKYVGSSQGPKKYYSRLSLGDDVSVIYDPCNPSLNCEINNFLNHPGHRHTFKKAGKLHLLDKFKDKFKLEDYTFEEWYRQQQQK